MRDDIEQTGPSMLSPSQSMVLRTFLILSLLIFVGYWFSHDQSVDDEGVPGFDGAMISQKLQRLVDSQLSKDGIQEISLSIADDSGSDPVHVSSGHVNGTQISERTPYFLTSTSKLFASAMIMQLRQEEKLNLDDPVVQFFPKGMLNGLHARLGKDMTDRVTIRHLLGHTSGLADYFGDERRDGTRLSTNLLAGRDMSLSLPDIVNGVREELEPHFSPGSGNKTYYSDTNYQLLGGIIESVTTRSLADNVEVRITRPLGLKNTYLYEARPDRPRQPVLPLRNGDETPDIPEAMGSARLDGGMVSTSAESLVFLRAFMNGELFPKRYLNDMQQWQPMSDRVKSGVGLMQYRLPWNLSPFGKRPMLIGHSGISGAFAYYSPSEDVYLTGTINQLANRHSPYRLMHKAMNRFKQ